MLEALVLLLAASCLGWSLINARRGNLPVAVGSAVTATVLGAAVAAGTLPVMAWVEGGHGMNVLVLPGGYALGAAAAFLLSGKPKAKWAAVIAAGVTGVLAAAFYLDGMREVEAVLRQVVDARDAELIREGARSELLRLIELGGVLVASTVLVLGIGRRRPPGQCLVGSHDSMSSALTK